MAEVAEQIPFDFGSDVKVITRPEEFAELPDEVAKRREVREASKTPVPEVPEVKGQAKAAAQAEIDHTGEIAFDFDGETYWVKPVDEWDLEIFEAQEDGKLVIMVRELLGAEQWAQFKSEQHPDRAEGIRRKKTRNIKHLTAILNAASKAASSADVGE